MQAENSLDRMHSLFERIRHLAELGLTVSDPLYCRQLLTEICFATSEFVAG